MPPVGLSVCRYVLWRSTEPVGGSKHDAAHGWPIVSPHRHVHVVSLFDGRWRKLCHRPGRQLNSTTHSTYLTSQQWRDVCKRSWFLICHQAALKLKASLLSPCASGSLSNEGLARLSLWSRLRFSFTWQDSWPISILTLPCTFTLLRRRAAQSRVLMLTNGRVGEVLLKILKLSS